MIKSHQELNIEPKIIIMNQYLLFILIKIAIKELF